MTLKREMEKDGKQKTRFKLLETSGTHAQSEGTNSSEMSELKCVYSEMLFMRKEIEHVRAAAETRHSGRIGRARALRGSRLDQTSDLKN